MVVAGLLNYSGPITVQGTTLTNGAADGMSHSLGALTLDGGTLAAVNAPDAALGNFQLRGDIAVGGSRGSIISADVRIIQDETKTFTVADTGDPSGIDLHVTGTLGHQSGVAWGYAVKDGPGTMKVSGPNGLGSLTVAGGRMILENRGIAGMPFGLVSQAQTELCVAAGNAVSLGSLLAGSGAITKSGSGTLGLHGFSGSLTVAITGGTLQLAGGHNNYWAVQHTVVSAGARLSNGTHSHIAELTLDGGELAATGVDPTWGSWMLDRDIIVIGSGTSLISAQRVAIANASNVSRVFDIAATATLEITGTFENAHTTTANGLTKTGHGTMILQAGSSYTGPTTVNQGVLLVNGSTSNQSALRIAATATLGGDGTVNGPIVVDSGGTLAPGSPIGTLNAGSTITLNGTLAIEIGEASADQLSVARNLNITNATLAISGTPTLDEYVIASFGSITGTAFAGVTGLPVGYHLVYDESGRRIILAAIGGYDGWAASHMVAGGPADDDDTDGLANLLEYVLRGDPKMASTVLMPTLRVNDGSAVFQFSREAQTVQDTIQVFQLGADLVAWTELPLVAGEMVSIVSEDDRPGMEQVTITVPTGPSGRLFGRLKVCHITGPEPANQ
jgi:autotransporter-associated beta strand protein